MKNRGKRVPSKSPQSVTDALVDDERETMVLEPAELAERSPAPLKAASVAALLEREAYIESIGQAAPVLGQLFEVAAQEVVEKALIERSTDELIVQIDAGRFVAEIAVLWKVPSSELHAWIAGDVERCSRARLARKNQAALWDWVALQVLLHARSDRVEITRAEKIAQHCRWRAEAFSRDEYARTMKAAQPQEPKVRELTTLELEKIAQGELPPG